MADPRRESSAFGLPWWVAFVLLAMGLTRQTELLKSDRPADASGRDAKAEQRLLEVDARLWEDPISQARRLATGNRGRESGPSDRLTDALLGPARSGPPDGWIAGTSAVEPIDRVQKMLNQGTFWGAIAVMLPGGVYSENAEERRRMRVAVASALCHRHFAPRDSEHLALIEMPWPSKASMRAGLGDAKLETDDVLRIPVELFAAEPGAREPGEKALLWLDEKEFSDYPLTRLALVVWALENFETAKGLWRSPSAGLAEARTPSPTSTSSRILVIGPSSSSGLMRMTSEAIELERGSAWVAALFRGFADKVTLVSTRATAELQSRASSQTRTQACGSDVGLGMPRIDGTTSALPVVYRRMADDGELARMLKQEMDRRNVFSSARDSHPTPVSIAVVGEWDTVYGRAFGSSLRKVLTSKGDTPIATPELLTYSYLRGIDGRLALATGEGFSTKTEAPQPKPAQHLLPQGATESMDGLDQCDYLSRLADRMERTHRRALERGGLGIRAVVVVGSDTYDKILILKALRPRLPHTLFLTTDLDARLGHVDHLPWTRNLIIASPFNLRLHQNVAGDELPPFRDSYQTSLFYLLDSVLQGPLGPGLPNVRVPPALLFEVGLSQIVDITPLVGPYSIYEGDRIQPLRYDLSEPRLDWNSRDQLQNRLSTLIELWMAVICFVGVPCALLWLLLTAEEPAEFAGLRLARPAPGLDSEGNSAASGVERRYRWGTIGLWIAFLAFAGALGSFGAASQPQFSNGLLASRECVAICVAFLVYLLVFGRLVPVWLKMGAGHQAPMPAGSPESASDNRAVSPGSLAVLAGVAVLAWIAYWALPPEFGELWFRDRQFRLALRRALGELTRGIALGALVACLVFPAALWIRRWFVSSRRLSGRERIVALSAIVSLLVTGAIAYVASAVAPFAEVGDRPPVIWLQGVSDWGALVVVMSCIVLELWLMFAVLAVIGASDLETEAAYALPSPSGTTTLNALLTAELAAPLNRQFLEGDPDHAWMRGKKRGLEVLPVSELWATYRRKGMVCCRTYRALIGSILCALVATLMVWLRYQPQPPIRASFELSSTVLWIGTIVASFVTFLVVDEVLLCTAFAYALSHRKSGWDPSLLEAYEQGHVGDATAAVLPRSVSLATGQRPENPGGTSSAPVDPVIADAVGELLDIQILAERTQVVSRLLYLPILSIVLLSCARSPYLSRAGWSTDQSILIGGLLAMILGCALLLNQTAGRAKQLALERQSYRISRAATVGDPKLSEKLDKLTKRIDAIEDGAFAPLERHPLLGYLVMGGGSLGVPALLELLFK
ncbi:MAG: hypothetical protein HY303_18465 [Candidatus Wallbacteria bacterium]|nr:hypothetical protein [Candidatus Wallbacteria bacterium]